MSTWSDVRKGTVIIGKDAREWTCTGVIGRKVTMSRAGRSPHTAERPADDVPVRIVSQPAPVPIGQQPGVAQALVAVKLGGVVVSKRPRDKRMPHNTPVEYLDPASLLAHLFIFHGVTCDIQDLAGITAEHARLHGPNEKAADTYEPHVHTPDFDDL